MARRLVTVFGGSGFIGRYVVERLAARGDLVRVAVRRPNEALFLKPLGELGQVQLMAANLKHEGSVRRAVAGADVVINLVGVLFNAGGQTFSALQDEGAGRVAQYAAEAGVKAMVHMSALGADAESESEYARTKAAGEAAVLDAFPSATIFRPSVVFGAEDGFFNRFATLINALPFLPIPGAETRFQPVFVDDVAAAIERATLGGKMVEGKTFELGGPQQMTLRALLQLLMAQMGTSKPIINLPWGIALLQASFLGLLPNPPLTRDQVKLLMKDNVVSGEEPGFESFQIDPKPAAAILPSYIAQHRKGGQFHKA